MVCRDGVNTAAYEVEQYDISSYSQYSSTSKIKTYALQLAEYLVDGLVAAFFMKFTNHE